MNAQETAKIIVEGELKLILKNIRGTLEISSEGLLKNDRYLGTLYAAVDTLSKVKDYFDEKDQLRIEKLNFDHQWKFEPKPGFTKSHEEVEEKLLPFQVLSEHLLDAIKNEDKLSSVPIEAHISQGRPYDGRKAFKSILDNAKSELILVDSYLHPDILKTLHLYMEENDNLRVRLITSNGNKAKFNALISDYKLFQNQYPNIELRENNVIHDRYIIVDGTEVYHSGHSFNELGQKASSINKMENPKVITKIKTEIEDAWNKGKTI